MNESVTPNTPGLIRLARAELAQTRANLCTHGVPVAACHDHRTDDSKGGYTPGPAAPVMVSDDECFLNPAGACVRNDARHSHAAATDQPDQEEA